MDTVNKKQIPTPEQRPDLYDDFDYTNRPEGQSTGVKTPPHIQEMIDQRQAKAAPDNKKE